jgi:glycosyltransferase involved in cell wall biosynthesis
MIRAAAAIITPTQAVKDELSERFKIDAGRITVTPEAPRTNFCPMVAAESELVRKRLGIEDEFILFVGTIEPRKNLLTLVRAFEEIVRSDSRRPQLVIAGATGWLSQDVFAYVQAAGVSDRIRFVGYLTDHDLRALYSACRTFVYPSLYEGFGLPLLEAMACGAPVITSDTPSIRETVGEAALLVSPTDSSGLTQAIARLLDNAAERQERSVAGMRHARKFSWEKTARATLDLYREVLKKGNYLKTK